MKKIRIIIVIVALFAITFAIYYIFHPLVYYTRYFEKIGVKTSHLYEDIVKDKGEPNSTKIEGDEFFAYYDGLTLVFNKGVNDYFLLRAEVTGDPYRFGIWSIGIGTNRNKVESVYKNVQKIIDLPEGEFGVIDDDIWVHFKFDSMNQVEKILIYYGP